MNNKNVRVPTGIFGLDKLVEGGFEKQSSNLIFGTAGSGKTTFALQFLYYGATKYNEPGIFISFNESKEELKKHHTRYGWNLENLESRGLIKFLKYKPHQINKLVEEGGGIIKDTINSIGAKRIVIDSITSYALLFKDEYKKRESIVALFEMLKKLGTTILITAEDSNNNLKNGELFFLTDSVIHLKYEIVDKVEDRQHLLEIIKMRGTKHSNKICTLSFETKGLKVYPNLL